MKLITRKHHPIHHTKAAQLKGHGAQFLEMARCILKEVNLHKYMWSHVIMSSRYIRNRFYNNRIGTTSYEIFTGTKSNLLNMHLFGSICYAYVQNPKK